MYQKIDFEKISNIYNTLVVSFKKVISQIRNGNFMTKKYIFLFLDVCRALHGKRFSFNGKFNSDTVALIDSNVIFLYYKCSFVQLTPIIQIFDTFV